MIFNVAKEKKGGKKNANDICGKKRVDARGRDDLEKSILLAKVLSDIGLVEDNDGGGLHFAGVRR